MPNYNALVYTAADYKYMLLVPSAAGQYIPFPLLTAQSMGDSHKTEDETGYAIGEIDPIFEKTNGNQYSGKLELQNGEMNNILRALNIASPIQIKGAQIAKTTYDGLINQVYSGVNIISADFDIKAKDKSSVVSCNWKAVKLTSI